MMQLQRLHHQRVFLALQSFNAEFLKENRIYFGGGTRLCLELDEYRESVDIDFLCPNRKAYIAVRETVSSDSLGQLVNRDFNYLREIRADRYGVRTLIEMTDTPIKLEFVSCDEYRLDADDSIELPVPSLSRISCFVTKLLANSDRLKMPPFKDAFDLAAMRLAWGEIPEAAWAEAKRLYGSLPERDWKRAQEDMKKRPEVYRKAAEQLQMKPEWIERILD